MSWAAITEANLLTAISGPELVAYRAAALGAGQADPVAPTMAQVTDLVRGYVAASGRNVLGLTGIPGKLLAPALDIIAYRIPSRVGMEPGATRKALHDDAVRLLEQVAAGKFGLEEPVTADTESTAAPSPSMTAATNYYTWDNADGV